MQAAKVKPKPTGFWKNSANHRALFDELGQSLGIKSYEDWYNVTGNQLKKIGASTLLINHFGGSLLKAIKEIYPEFAWQPWRFYQVPKNYWHDMENQRIYFGWLSEKLQINRLDDWYKVKTSDLRKVGAMKLLDDMYRSSLLNALKNVFPEYEWNPWRFAQVPKGFWMDSANVAGYLQWLSGQLMITQLDDWLFVTTDQVNATLLRIYGGIIPLLSRFYPHYPWKSKVGLAHKTSVSKAQTHLYKTLKQLLPHLEIKMNHIQSSMVFSHTNHAMEFDFFVPDKDVAIEYHGEQHYVDHYLYGTPQIVQQRDEEKREKCKASHLTLLEIPFWWNKEKGSLLATIYQKAPHLLTEQQLTFFTTEESKKWTPISSQPTPSAKKKLSRWTYRPSK